MLNVLGGLLTWVCLVVIYWFNNRLLIFNLWVILVTACLALTISCVVLSWHPGAHDPSPVFTDVTSARWGKFDY